MRSQPRPNATVPPRHRAIASRRFGGSLATGVLIAATFTLSACGSSGTPTGAKSSGAPASLTILNTEKVERAIEQSSLTQRGKRPQVSCPSGVHQQKGLVFTCTAVVKRDSTRFLVTQLDGSGQVHYEAR
jgi:hypothetical protein